jgi:Tfp pilus assembly protein PilX
MNRLRQLLGNERGVALVLALMVLLTLTGLVLAFLSVSAFEPQISRNHSDTVRARYVAEAGLEYAFDTLATNISSWNTYLAGATCTTGAVLGTASSTLPGLTSANGTFTVRVRNDCNSGDNKITGVTVEASANATTDTNNKLVVTSTGAVGNATRTVTLVVSKAAVPPISGSLSFPGVQSDVNFSGSAFLIDGRDYRMTDSPGSPTGTAPALYGISVNPDLPALETQVEAALAANQQNDVRGRDETSSTNPPGTTSGADTVQTDATLTSQAITDYVAALKAHADISITSSPSSPYSIASIGSTCSTDVTSATCWGTTSKPKIVYIKGDLPDLTTQFTALDVSGTSEGTGILIVEDGNVDISGGFRWNGPIIVTGNNVGIRYRGGGSQSVYGVVIVNELNADGGTNLEGDIRGNASLLYSSEALALVQDALSRRLVTTSSWSEQ